MAPQFYIVDFETASECDLKACGAEVYSRHWSTEILCLCWNREDRGDKGEWTPPSDTGTMHQLIELTDDPDVIFVAHNALFEKAIWRNIMMPRYGFPDIPDRQWRDTMASCAQRGLPLGLDDALRALKGPQKDMEGSRFTIGLSQGRKRLEGWRQRVLDYCHHDVDDEIWLWKTLGGLVDGEHKVWLMDQHINATGVKLDMDFVHQCQKIVADASGPLAEEFKALTGFKMGQIAKVREWCASRGVEIPNLQAETVDAILETKLPDDVHHALRIRSLVYSASIKKLEKMEKCTVDGVAYNLLQYHGAGTGRWAGRLLQPQNFPRGSVKLDDKPISPQLVVDAIMTGDHRHVELVCDAPAVEVVVGALRHAIVARPDHLLVVGDYAGIEARIVLALAGSDKAQLMASGADVYCDMAEQIYGRSITKADVKERTIGKNTVLGCGFGMGAEKFHMRYCPDRDISFAEDVIQAYRKEWAPEVPKMWYALEDAAVQTVLTGRSHTAYGVTFAIEGDRLTALLPSGRRLWYQGPQIYMAPLPWDFEREKPAYYYLAQKNSHWTRVYAYGGIVTENTVQALARDLMVDAMFKLKNHPVLRRADGRFPVILTVHDEIVCEVEKGDPAVLAKALQDVMEDRPRWAVDIGVPVSAECWAGDRYHK